MVQYNVLELFSGINLIYQGIIADILYFILVIIFFKKQYMYIVKSLKIGRKYTDNIK